eukprot:9496158-Pyramimonas_sp.AAC.1
MCTLRPCAPSAPTDEVAENMPPGDNEPSVTLPPRERYHPDPPFSLGPLIIHVDPAPLLVHLTVEQPLRVRLHGECHSGVTPVR